ncbi:hypothetical protein H5410_020476 [Solanum commersonii]|uniref:Uncharacterized protein n=1 Tax=Solanum commersonii TaxID=4109 RepID=A0A9J5Z846_SOLCO|nr:hypothetical protein H5410_020476 [Solanum commersonii]
MPTPKREENTSSKFPTSIYSSLPRIRTIRLLSMSQKTRGASGGNLGVFKILWLLWWFEFKEVVELFPSNSSPGSLPGKSPLKNSSSSSLKRLKNEEQNREEDKAKLVEEIGFQLKQKKKKNWFINQSKRNWHSNS